MAVVMFCYWQNIFSLKQKDQSGSNTRIFHLISNQRHPEGSPDSILRLVGFFSPICIETKKEGSPLSHFLSSWLPPCQAIKRAKLLNAAMPDVIMSSNMAPIDLFLAISYENVYICWITCALSFVVVWSYHCYLCFKIRSAN